ncbi:MAG: hypothetical protein ACXQS8_05485, partial [Candidatus Helarchaeales archaeon]
MTSLALLLHFHQPFYAAESFIQSVIQKCYEPLLHVMENFLNESDASLNLNFSGALLEWFERIGRSDLIDILKNLTRMNKVEFLGTTFYQAPIFLTPIGLINEQIYHHFKILKDLFNFKPMGFFPPELIFTKDIVPPLRQNGFKYVIIEQQEPLGQTMTPFFKCEFFQAEIPLIARNKNYSLQISHGNTSPKELLK